MSILAAAIVPHPPIILPEIGKGEEKKIQATTDAYEEVMRRFAELEPDTVIITSPHAVMYADYFHISPGEHAQGDLRKFGVNGNKKTKVDYDAEMAAEISKDAISAGIPAGIMGERDKNLDHGTLIPLHFLNKHYTDYKLVRIGLSDFSYITHYKFGKSISRAVEGLGRRAVFIASGDLSHKLLESGPYGYTPEGSEFDDRMIEIMRSGGFGNLFDMSPSFCNAAAECGMRSFLIMAGALSGRMVNAELLSYEGVFGVGYGVGYFQAGEKDSGRCFDLKYEASQRKKLDTIKDGEDLYVKLARYSLEGRINEGIPVGLNSEYITQLPNEMFENQAGVFVSLKKDGQLRGCIGTIAPSTGSIAEEILKNAVSAGTADPRFDPVDKEELPDLVYSVDVLDKPEPITSIDELDVKQYGVIVTSGYKRGLLLPNLDGVDTPEQQVKIAMQKAGITEKDKYALERFMVVRHQ